MTVNFTMKCRLLNIIRAGIWSRSRDVLPSRLGQTAQRLSLVSVWDCFVYRMISSRWSRRFMRAVRRGVATIEK